MEQSVRETFTTESLNVQTALKVLEQTITTVCPAQFPELVGELERLKALVFARLLQQPGPEKGNLLDAQQVAVRLNIPVSYVYELARREALKAIKLGKYV